MNNQYTNISASAEIKDTQGILTGMYVNSTSSGTIKFNDGLSSTASVGVNATGVLTGTDVFTDGETVTIGNKVYTMVDALTHTANQIKIGTLAVTLDNLKLAINGGAGAGTLFSYGTDAHTQVTATTNTDTAQTVAAIVSGTGPNAYATTETASDVSWGALVLEGGVAVNTLMNNTITPAIGYHALGGANFTNGLYATIANTLNVTLYYQ